jgi:protein gp37
MENTGISWAHNTQNFWVGCDKIAPECAKCYISRDLRKQGREAWGKLYLTQTWSDPFRWQSGAARAENYRRVFTCSLSDFFHAKADGWRDRAWAVMKYTPNLVWLVLTKRPERIEKRLPADWPYPNVWLGVSTACKQTLIKMDTLRKIPVHDQAVRWISSEPLLEDISQEINLDGFGWVVTGGESGSGDEYQWDSAADWRNEFTTGGRRTMRLEWARNLRDVTKNAGLPFMFKQVTHPLPGYGADALGRIWHEYPNPPKVPDSWPWKPQPTTEAKHLMKDDDQIVQIVGGIK